eukprot:4920019-Alexandrium_andersonii.AAC.1
MSGEPTRRLAEGRLKRGAEPKKRARRRSLAKCQQLGKAGISQQATREASADLKPRRPRGQACKVQAALLRQRISALGERVLELCGLFRSDPGQSRNGQP